MQSISISLLTRDGALSATFTPALTPAQYESLVAAIRADGNYNAELKDLLTAFADEHGLALIVVPR